MDDIDALLGALEQSFLAEQQPADNHGHSHSGEPCHGHRDVAPPAESHTAAENQGHSHGGEPPTIDMVAPASGMCVGFAACTPHNSVAGSHSSAPELDGCRCFECGRLAPRPTVCPHCESVYYCTPQCQQQSWERPAAAAGHAAACARFRELAMQEEARVQQLPFADAVEMATAGFDM